MTTTHPLRVVVTGSRHWTNGPAIELALAALDSEHHPRGVVLAHGNASGADRIAGRVAHDLGWAVCPFPVDLSIDGPWPAAGQHRNRRMLDTFKPDRLIAFRAPGKSNGTDGCVAAARARGIPVTVVRP